MASSFSFRAHWPEKNSRMATDNFALLRLVCDEEIDGNSNDDDEAKRRLLDRRGHVEHDEAALHDLHDERADQRFADRARGRRTG